MIITIYIISRILYSLLNDSLRNNSFFEFPKFSFTKLLFPKLSFLPLEEAPFENYRDYPICFWQEILTRLYHFYRKPVPSRKALLKFREGLLCNTEKTIILTKSSNAKICRAFLSPINDIMIDIQFLI